MRADINSELAQIAAAMSRSIYLREWRETRGVTQEALASSMDISRGYLSDLERGEKRYNQDMLELAAAALNCSPADLISGPPEGRPETPLNSLDGRLLALSIKAAMEEALQAEARPAPVQMAHISETAARIYLAYISTRETAQSHTPGS